VAPVPNHVARSASYRPPAPAPDAIQEIRGQLALVRSRVCLADGDTITRAAALRSLDDADRSLRRWGNGLTTKTPVPLLHKGGVDRG
jgi:hypothetical protein